MSRPACLLLAEPVWGAPLHAARSLHAARVPVLIATAGRGAHIFGRSRCRPAVVDLDPVDGRRFLDDALRWARSQVPDRPIVVLPFSDRMTEAMHRNRDLLAEPVRPVLASADSLDVLLDKAPSMSTASDAGLTVPPWCTIASEQDLSSIDALAAPVVLKPASWASSDSSRFKISVHGTHDEARQTAARVVGDGATLIAQEYRRVPDDHVEFAVTWRGTDGSPTAVCTGRKRRQSTRDGGVMAWGETDPLPDVAAAAEAFLDATGFTGPGGIEFVRTGSGIEFIEFNPRIEAIHFLSATAGVDVVRLSYDDVALDRRPSSVPSCSPAAAWIGPAWIARLTAHPADLRLLVRDRIEFARHPRRDRAVLSWSDPAPAAMLAADLVKAGFRRVTSKASRR